MTLFWSIAGIFMAAGSLFILFPLMIGRRKKKSVAPDAMNISVYRDQFAELDADRRNGILSPDQYDQGKQELQRRLLQDVRQVEEKVSITRDSKVNGQPGVVTAAILAVAVPVLAVLLYMQLGNPSGLMSQAAAEVATQPPNEQAGATEQLSSEKLDTLVEKLAAHLKVQPGDAEGWAMLARTYATMERFNDASNAYARLVALTPNNPGALADYAEVMAMTHKGQFAGKPAELINKALQIDPRHPQALALAGVAEFEQKKFRQAADYWERLQAVIPADSEIAPSVAKSIAEAKLLALSENAGGGTPVRAKVTQSNEFASKNSPPAESKRDTAAPAAGRISVSGSVTLNPALAARTAPSDTLFIFARAKEGPKMPLAILRLQAKNLPASFTLDDTMAMSPAMKLSNFSEVVVGARISKSGNALPQSGDLQGFSQAVKIGDQAVSVVIDQQVP